MLAVLKNRDYRFLWSGQAISHLGDTFHAVALPWLVLAVTRDPLQLGFVLAAAGIPRAVLMLFGGAIADRFSPRKIMLVSDILRFLITAALVYAILSGGVQLWMIYVLAISFGIVSGFFLPAAEATIPRILPGEQLEGGNSLMMIVSQVAQFVGPAAAGTLVAVLSGAANANEAGLTGIAIAFAFDATTFLVSAITLWLMSPLPGLGSDKRPLQDVTEGLRYAVGNVTVRTFVIIVALANFLVTGPLTVGVPVLASERLPQGAAAFGLIVSGYALGNLFGMAGAGALPRPAPRVLGIVATALFGAFAVIFGSMAIITSTWLAVGMMVVAGIGNGYIAIIVIAALQRMAPKRMLGRLMSLVMLSMYGLMPISMAVAGAVVKISLPALFVGTAIGLLVPGVIAWTHRDMFEFTPAETAADAPAGLTATAPEPAAM